MTPSEIKGLRERLSMTQAEFADNLDVTQASVAQWERGVTSPNKQVEAMLETWKEILDERSREDWRRFAAQAGMAVGASLLLNYFRER